MRIGVIGCGFVADFYLATLPNHPALTVAGVSDRDARRAAHLAAHYRVPVYESSADLLADPSVPLVLNLTNPDQHYTVSRAILEAGKHVYSEKPLAMEFGQAEALVALAATRGLQISCAPCSILGEAAQTAWRLLRKNAIGRVRLAYAELDNGMVHRMGYKHWRSPSGTPWPYQDEFRVGCTIEHAAYYVTWLLALFGPVAQMTSYAACLAPEKAADAGLETMAPDFSVGLLEFTGGVVARITCSSVAPRDHTLRLIGDDGVLTVENGWFYDSRVTVTAAAAPRRSIGAALRRRLSLTRPPDRAQRDVPLVRSANYRHRYNGGASHQMDFARGVADLADAIEEGRQPRISAAFALHATEIILALHSPEQMGPVRRLTTSFPAMEPMPWAADISQPEGFRRLAASAAGRAQTEPT